MLNVLLSLLTLGVAKGDAPLDCNTPEGFKRLFDGAQAVVKASPLPDQTEYCGSGVSQFSVLSVVRSKKDDSMTQIYPGEEIKVYQQSDTPGIRTVPTNQGNVLLMLYSPSDFDRPSDCNETTFPSNTFGLSDCGSQKPLEKLSAYELNVVGELLCGTVDDDCMNQENLNACRALVDADCYNLMVMESCPVQFGCADVCCLAVPQCEDGLFESTVPCCDGEVGCTKTSMCCESVYCRTTKEARCSNDLDDSAARSTSFSFDGAALMALPVFFELGR